MMSEIESQQSGINGERSHGCNWLGQAYVDDMCVCDWVIDEVFLHCTC